MKINSGGPAFPQGQVDYGNGPEDPWPWGMGGMDLRAYFAGQALTGLAAAHTPDGTWAAYGCEQGAAALSVRLADALIAELAKPGNAKAEGGEG